MGRGSGGRQAGSAEPEDKEDLSHHHLLPEYRGPGEITQTYNVYLTWDHKATRIYGTRQGYRLQ